MCDRHFTGHFKVGTFNPKTSPIHPFIYSLNVNTISAKLLWALRMQQYTHTCASLFAGLILAGQRRTINKQTTFGSIKEYEVGMLIAFLEGRF